MRGRPTVAERALVELMNMLSASVRIIILHLHVRDGGLLDSVQFITCGGWRLMGAAIRARNIELVQIVVQVLQGGGHDEDVSISVDMGDVLQSMTECSARK